MGLERAHNPGPMKAFVALLLTCAFAAHGTTAQTAPAQEVTISSGYFDDYLMLAADKVSGQLSGYYDDGRCRFYFQGPLKPRALPQRADLGEAYQPESVLLPRPGDVFTTEIYSRAKNGYRNQITLEPHTQEAASHCRRRITLDRASSVSNSFGGVRVVLKQHIRLYKPVTLASGKVQVWRDWGTKSPPYLSGVWTSNEAFMLRATPLGYVYVAWYEYGAPKAAYVRLVDVYPHGPAGEQRGAPSD